MTIWFNKQTKSISLHFYPQHFKMGIVKYNNNARKFIDSCYDLNIIFFGIHFSYTNWEYNRITNVIVDTRHHYVNANDHENIDAFKKQLKVISDDFKNGNINQSVLPLSVAFEQVDEDNIVYYISAPKSYFEHINIRSILPTEYNPYYCERILEAQKEHKFPKYSKHVKKIIWL